MNVTKLITTLQQVANTATTAAQYAALSKSVEKLELGKVVTVSTTANLPTNLTTNGNVYFVSSDEDLYYNVGSTWKRFYNFNNVLYAWGSNASGRLGDGTTSSRLSPAIVIGGITNWSSISCAREHSLGVTDSGIAYAWGRNDFGQLGDNTTSSRSSPVTVVGGIATWTQVTGGRYQTLGLISSGIVYSWGRNNVGQLGDNTTTDRSSPVTVIGGVTSWSKLSAGGGDHNLGITSPGTLYAWGGNSLGQLGDGTTSNRSSPVTVIGGITNWSAISGSKLSHSLGATSGGSLYAWGRNNYGPLGDNTTSNRSSPVTVVGGITNWSQVSGGQNHSLGLTENKVLYAWGRGDSGQLGNNSGFSQLSPITAVGGITNWTDISAGGDFSAALTSAGTIYAWGENFAGVLGDNTTSNRSSPVTVVGGITNWNLIATGSLHIIAINTVIL